MLRSPIRALAAGLAAIATLLLISTATASAAQVSVTETSGEPNTATLDYVAAPGENTALTVTHPATTQVRLVDAGAAISPGAACTGGGAVGVPVTCTMHEPKWYDRESCGRDCSRVVPGTRWEATMRIALGDGENSFDGTAFTGTHTQGVGMTVSSGAGDDHISTGGGEDVIDPGAGRDVVNGGDGHNEFIATAEPDGPDVYESGPVVATMNYSARSAPVLLHGSIAGAAGEEDLLTGYFKVIGGSGDDVLKGSSTISWLEGGPGNDVLRATNKSQNSVYGGPGDDKLFASGELDHLVGEEGDDFYQGGPGVDIIRDAEPHETLGSKAVAIPSREGGNDVARGGGGDDAIGLGVGRDRLYGGSGADDLDGESGKDYISGGPGADRLIGGRGFDRLFGGAGSDILFSGRWKWRPGGGNGFPFPPAPNDGPDKDVCGPGRDIAVANPWDRTRGCEVVRIVRNPVHPQHRSHHGHNPSRIG